ncbi:hypothetical protein [Streptomyces sp. NPDC057582]
MATYELAEGVLGAAANAALTAGAAAVVGCPAGGCSTPDDVSVDSHKL